MERRRRKGTAVAVSGGVDSLCALLMLKNSGHDVFAIHALLAEEDTDKEFALQTVCRSLGVELVIVDLRPVFVKHVIAPFVESYASGHTPNPCAICNKFIKFGALLEKSLELGADMLATGHYANIDLMDGKPILRMAADDAKDQSYFLALLKPESLSKIHFPLAGLTKSQCRAIVAANGLSVPVGNESQDICFLQSGEGYGCFLRERAPELGLRLSENGPIYLQNASGERKIMPLEHNGLWNYTLGQRRGLGIPYSEPLYVTGKDVEANALFVGPKECCLMHGCVAYGGSVFVSPDKWPEEIFVKLRYKQKIVPAKVDVAAGRLRIDLNEPQFPSDTGQIAAIYNNVGMILASGIITEIY